MDMPPSPYARPTGTGRLIGIVAGLVVAAVFAGIGLAALAGDPEEPEPGGPDTARCTPATTEQTGIDGDATHKQGPIDYGARPPSSGSHHPMPLGAFQRVVSYDDPPELVVERAVHNLEHGYVIVWYDDDASEFDLRSTLGPSEERKVIAVPWRRGQFPGAVDYVITAWGARQECEVISLRVVEEFFTRHGGENGIAPEKSAP